jgi:hypothetical protein
MLAPPKNLHLVSVQTQEITVRLSGVLLVTLLILTVSRLTVLADSSFDYPFTNPYEATVIEAPPPYQTVLPETVPTRIVKLDIPPRRKIPEVFWYENGLACSLVYQQHTAPLIFILAGTGARYDSPKMLNLQRVFYQAGFHVLSLTSPTHMDFIINASGSRVPGNLEEDARDLYRVMRLAMDKVGTDITVSDFYLTGYSLGGIQSAYIAHLDDTLGHFNFRKILLINPPVNLYRSVTILDRLLAENIPGGINNFQPWLNDVMRNLSDIYKEMGYFEFSGEYVYKVHQRYPRQEHFLRAIIGLSFRLSSSNMIFAADVMNGGGYITPRPARFDYATALTPYAMVAFRTTFADYFHEYLYPRMLERNPHLSEARAIDRLSLKRIESYLRQTPKIGVLHNQDDIILNQGDIAWLREVFGTRARIYPWGGHCGNMNHPAVVRFMTTFFSREED